MILTGNIQDVREQLVELLDAATPDGWVASAATKPDIYTGLIHVGHVTETKADTYKAHLYTLPITLWADETGSVTNASSLYGLISPIPGSLLRFLLKGKECPIIEFSVGEVGPRVEGPSTFLAVTISVRFQVLSTPDPT